MPAARAGKKVNREHSCDQVTASQPRQGATQALYKIHYITTYKTSTKLLTKPVTKPYFRALTPSLLSVITEAIGCV